VTNRQRFAFEHCFIEKRCAAEGYRWVRLRWSVILTLNVGLDDAFVECQRLIRSETLAGVGDSSREHVQIGDHALHFRRCRSELEIEELNKRGFWPRPHDRARWN